MLGRAMLLLMLIPTVAYSQTADERGRLKDFIWKKEQENYKARGTMSGMASYISSISDDYMVWPPGSAAPMRPTELKSRAAKMDNAGKEKLELSFTDFTVHDGTAIIYYSSHKTVTAMGAPVDERYDTVHVWSRYGDEWKLMGGLARRTK